VTGGGSSGPAGESIEPEPETETEPGSAPPLPAEPAIAQGSPLLAAEPAIAQGSPLHPAEPLLAVGPTLLSAVPALAVAPPRPVWPTIREVLSGSFDLVTGARIRLRDASLYIGLLLLLTVGPLAVAVIAEAPGIDPDTFQGLSEWTAVAGLVAVPALIAISIEAQIIGLGILGGARVGRPLTLRQALRRSRLVFWRVFGASILVGIPTGIVALLLGAVLGAAFGGATDAAQVGSQLLVGVITAPFVYVVAGIVLGDVSAIEAVRRSILLAKARLRLAVIASLFAVIAQYLLVFAALAGADLVVRALEPFHAQLEEFDPASLGGFLLIAGGALVAVFAYGTLSFTIGALAAAPQVVAFLGLTGYSGGLDGAREAAEGEPPRPTPRWISPVMILGVVVAIASAVAAVSGALRP
jgi:hypothetical protein